MFGMFACASACSSTNCCDGHELATSLVRKRDAVTDLDQLPFATGYHEPSTLSEGRGRDDGLHPLHCYAAASLG